MDSVRSRFGPLVEIFFSILTFLSNTRAVLRAFLIPVDVGVHVLVEQDGKLVLIQQSYSQGWRLPGGGVDRHEPAQKAVLRELKEEIGLIRSDAPELQGLYVRRIAFATNVIALYRVRNAVFEFQPNFEIRNIMLASPNSLPSNILPAVRRRIKEIYCHHPPSPYW